MLDSTLEGAPLKLRLGGDFLVRIFVVGNSTDRGYLRR